MDGWKDHYIAQCQFWFYKVFPEKWRRCQTEYSKGAAVERVWFGVPIGYCRGVGDGHV
jgi:hypothetical protein